jgi:glutathione S-transferase
MITLHALQYSRATRVLWLLADLGQPCERVDYRRTEAFRAPEDLSRVHPLGKSPVIEDDGETIAESATILRYLVEKYGDTTHRPPHGTPAFWRHEALLDYVEGSFAPSPCAPSCRLSPASRCPSRPKRRSTIISPISPVNAATGRCSSARLRCWPTSSSPTCSRCSTASAFSEGHPAVADYWKQLQRQPGYIAATEAAGPRPRRPNRHTQPTVSHPLAGHRAYRPGQTGPERHSNSKGYPS